MISRAAVQLRSSRLMPVSTTKCTVSGAASSSSDSAVRGLGSSGSLMRVSPSWIITWARWSSGTWRPSASSARKRNVMTGKARASTSVNSTRSTGPWADAGKTNRLSTASNSRTATLRRAGRKAAQLPCLRPAAWACDSLGTIEEAEPIPVSRARTGTGRVSKESLHADYLTAATGLPSPGSRDRRATIR